MYMSEGRCVNANIMATMMLANNEAFAREMTNLAQQKKGAEYWMQEGKNADDIVEQINGKIAAAYNSRILLGQVGGIEAKKSLVMQIANMGGSMIDALRMLDYVDTMSLKGMEEFAELWAKEYNLDAKEVVFYFKENLARYITTQQQMNTLYGMKMETKKKTIYVSPSTRNMMKGVYVGEKEVPIDKNYVDDSGKTYKKAIAEQNLKNRQEKQGWEWSDVSPKKKKKWENKVIAESKSGELSEWDKKIIELIEQDKAKVAEGETPNAMFAADKTWRDIVKQTGNNIKKREELLNNYLVGRFFLGELHQGEDVMAEFFKIVGKTKNVLPSLTLDDIDKFESFDELVQRVYLNAGDIVNNKELREKIYNKAMQLFNDGADDAFVGEFIKIKQLLNIAGTAEAGGNFTVVLKYNNAAEGIRYVMGRYDKFEWNGTSKGLYEAFIDILKDKNLIKKLQEGKTIKFGGVNIGGEDIIRMLYAITWDDSVRKVIKDLSVELSQDTIIKYASAKLFGLDSNVGIENVRKLVKDLAPTYTLDDLSSIAFRSITDIPVDTSKGVIFVDFDKPQRLSNNSFMLRADMNDALADVYSLNVLNRDNFRGYKIADFSLSEGNKKSKDVLVEDLKARGVKYIVVPTQGNAYDVRIKALQESLGKDVIVIAPRSRQSGQFYMDGVGNLGFKTTNGRFYNEIVDKFSIESVKGASITESSDINTILRESDYQGRLDALNDAMERFYREYLGVPEGKVSKDKLYAMITDMTGIPLDVTKPINAEDWERIQDLMFMGYSATGKYTKEIRTATELKNLIDTIEHADREVIFKELRDMGFDIDETTAEINLRAIKQALINMKTTDNLSTYIWNKGIIAGLANKDIVSDITIDSLKNILTSSNPRAALGRLLFGNRQVSKDEYKFIDSYLEQILDAITNDFVKNAINNGYRMPLINPRKAIYQYLEGKVSIGDEFVSAFLYKNGLPETDQTMKGLFDSYISNEIKVGDIIDESTLKGMRVEIEDGKDLAVFVEKENVMLPALYNSYYIARGKYYPTVHPIGIQDELVEVTVDDIKNSLRKYFTEEEIKEFNIKVVKNMVDENKMPVLGGFDDGEGILFKFNNKILDGTVDHETVHAYLSMFTSDKEKRKLFDYTRTHHRNEIERFAKQRRYADIYSALRESDESAYIDRITEEWLAENFIKYGQKKLGKKGVKGLSKLGEAITDLFEKIWNNIQSLLGNRRIEDFYDDIINKKRPNQDVMRGKGNGMKYQTIDNGGAIPMGNITTKGNEILNQLIERNEKKYGDSNLKAKDLKEGLGRLKSQGGKNVETEIFSDALKFAEEENIDYPGQQLKDAINFYASPLSIETSNIFSNYNKADSYEENPEYVHVYVNNNDEFNSIGDNAWMRIINKINDNKDNITYAHYDIPNQIFFARHYEPEKGLYKIIELQSDLIQHKVFYDALKEELASSKNPYKDDIEKYLKFMERNWYKRVLQEEIYFAKQMGYDKLQFPTHYEVADIEGYLKPDQIRIDPVNRLMQWDDGSWQKINGEEKMYLTNYGTDDIIILDKNVVESIPIVDEDYVIADMIRKTYIDSVDSPKQYRFESKMYGAIDNAISRKLYDEGKITRNDFETVVDGDKGRKWTRTFIHNYITDWTTEDFLDIFNSLNLFYKRDARQRLSNGTSIPRFTPNSPFDYDLGGLVLLEEGNGKYRYGLVDGGDVQSLSSNEIQELTEGEPYFDVSSLRRDKGEAVLDKYKKDYEATFKKVAKGDYGVEPKEVIGKYGLPCYEIDLNEIKNVDKITLYQTMPNVDNTGRELTQSQMEYFQNSKARDDNGRLIKVYRGATSGNEDIDLGKSMYFAGRDGSDNSNLKLFFSSDENVAKYFGGSRRKRGGRFTNIDEIRAALKDRSERNREFDINDLGNGKYEVVESSTLLYPESIVNDEFINETKENGFKIRRSIVGKEGDSVNIKQDKIHFVGTLEDIDKNFDRFYTRLETGRRREPYMYESYLNIENPFIFDCKGAEWDSIDFNGDVVNVDFIADWAKQEGYDGVILKNVNEQFYRDGKKLEGNFLTDDFVVFDPKQVKSVENLNPTNDVNWRFQTSPYQKGLNTLEKLNKYLNGDVMRYDGLNKEEFLDKYGKYDSRFFSKEYPSDEYLLIEALISPNIVGRPKTLDEAIKNYKERRDNIDNPSLHYAIGGRDIDELLSKIDKSKFSFGGGVDNVDDIGDALLDYMYTTLDESEIGDLVNKDSLRIKWKGGVDELSDEGKLALLQRLGAYEELNRALANISRYERETDTASDLLDKSRTLYESIEKIRNKISSNKKVDKLFETNIPLDDFIKKYSFNGFLPYELGIITDSNNNVLHVITSGDPIQTFTPITEKERKKGNLKIFHNHPGLSFFSDADMKSMMGKTKFIDTYGLILPGGVIFEFPAGKELKSLKEKYGNTESFIINAYRSDPRKFGGLIMSNMESADTILAGYQIAKELGVLDKQRWGDYWEAIENMEKSNHTDYATLVADVKDVSYNQDKDMVEKLTELLTPAGEKNMTWQTMPTDVPRMSAPNPDKDGIGLTEEGVVERILKKYEEAVEEHLKNGTLTLKVATDLKFQASYALDMAGQDLILSRYGGTLTNEERNGILGMKYGLRLASDKNELKELKEADNRILQQFRQSKAMIGNRLNKVYNNDEEIVDELSKSGKVITNINGQTVIVDVYDELERAIKSIPDGAGQLRELKSLSKGAMKGYTPQQAYALIKTIDLVKNAMARGNYYYQAMFLASPELKKSGMDFFQRFKVNSDGVPGALVRNATNGYVEEGKGVGDATDTSVKKEITEAIYNRFISKKRILTTEDLNAIVDEVANNNGVSKYAQLYKNSFAPYTKLRGVPQEARTYIQDTLKAEAEATRKLIEKVGGDLSGIRNLEVTLDDGTRVTVGDILDSNIDAWMPRLFGDKTEKVDLPVSMTESEITDLVKGMYAYLNDADFISQNEASIIHGILGNARKILEKDTNTNRFVEFDYAIGGQNDILYELMDENVFNGWKSVQGETIGEKASSIAHTARGFINKAIPGTKPITFFNENNWRQVQELYSYYYAQSTRELANMGLPNDPLHRVAYELAKYFKTMEDMLGSKNGATGISTKIGINKAFGNIGNIVKNVNREDEVLSLMRKIQNNQVLGFFRFSDSTDESIKWLKDITKNRSRVWFGNGRVEYITKLGETTNSDAISKQLAEEFNGMFGTKFSTREVNIILQGLGGYDIAAGVVGRIMKNFSRLLSSTNRGLRMLMTYPFQLFTIRPQLFAYNVKADAFKRMVGIENLKDMTKIRKDYGILEGVYAEINNINPLKFFFDNIKPMDEEVAQNLGLELSDGVMTMYGKTSEYISKQYSAEQAMQTFDSVRDNANNIIDAMMSSHFKGLAFIRALQTNNVMKFMNADDFAEFMARSDVTQEVKNRVVRAVEVQANRVFRDMLGTGFSGLDRMYGGNAMEQLLYGVMETLNFKGAWGLNMFRQTFEKAWTIFDTCLERGGSIFGKGGEGYEEMVGYIVNSQEFRNLAAALFNDLKWMWKLGRISDNGQVPEEETEVGVMDFVAWAADNAEFVSQQWQGILSFGGIRPFTQMGMSIIKGQSDGMDKYGIGAFINALGQNFGRQWKVPGLLVNALLIAEQAGDIQAGWDYLSRNFYTVSAGTMRYIIDDTINSYGMKIPLTIDTQGYNFIRGEQFEGGDTAFSYRLNNETTYQLAKAGKIGQIWTRLCNSSQIMNLASNAIKEGLWLVGMKDRNALTNKSPYFIDTLYEDLKDSPTMREFVDTGKPKPQTHEQMDKFIKRFAKGYYPGGYKAYQGIENFLIKGYVEVNNKTGEGKSYNADLEEFYRRIEEKEPGALKAFYRIFMENYENDPTQEAARQYTEAVLSKWLDKYFSDDPEYGKYQALFVKGYLDRIYYNRQQEMLANEKQRFIDMGIKKGTASVTWNELSYEKQDEVNKKFIDDYYDVMYDSDMKDMQWMIFNWIGDELDPEISSKYFVKEENDDGDIEWTMNKAMKAQVLQFIEGEMYLNKGDWAQALATYASLASYIDEYDDKGITRAKLLDFVVQRIDDSNLPPAIKAATKAQVVDNNPTAFTIDSEYAKQHPEEYALMKEYYNDTIHRISSSIIEDLRDAAIQQDTAANASSGRNGGSANAARNGLKNLENALKNLQQGGHGANGTDKGNVKFKILPVEIKGVYGKPAKAKIDFKTMFNYDTVGYSPKTKTLGPKVSGNGQTKTNKSLTVKNKQLSQTKLEKAELS